MDGYRVGIITRTKNRPLLLRRAIQSVANQTYKNYVHIIVNDGDSLEHQTLTGETIIVPNTMRYQLIKFVLLTDINIQAS